MILRLLLLTFAAALTVSSAQSDSWPEFRGPTGQGVSAARNLPVEWSSTKNVAWKQTIPGKGWSSPVLVAGRIYLTSAVEAEAASTLSLRAICLESTTGKIRWNTEVCASGAGQETHIHNKNSHASPTPIVRADRIYVHFGPQGTACLDLDGKVVWRNTSIHYPPVHGSGGSPILVDNALIFSCDGANEPFLIALNKDTGEEIWRMKRPTDAKKKFSFSTPLLITVNGREQVISPGSGAVCAYEPKTGREIWRARYGEGYSVIPRPVYGHGLIFLSSGFDAPRAIAVRPDGRGDVTDSHIAWTVTRGAPNTPSLLLAGDELYLVSDAGIVSCLDARTGEAHWQERIGGACSSSPIFGDGKIYVQREDGTGVVLKAGKTFEKLSSNPLGERTLASYAVGDGALYIRGEQHLYRIGK
jgi:outer membrane protein assembly factor BamB